MCSATALFSVHSIIGLIERICECMHFRMWFLKSSLGIKKYPGNLISALLKENQKEQMRLLKSVIPYYELLCLSEVLAQTMLPWEA